MRTAPVNPFLVAIAALQPSLKMFFIKDGCGNAAASENVFARVVHWTASENQF